MASRTNVSDGIIAANLDGRARFLLEHQVPRDQAVEALREIGATPDQIRDAAAASRRYFADRHPVQASEAEAVADLLERLL